CGRAPNAGCHVKNNRSAELIIQVEKFDRIDDAFYPLLGYQIGKISGSKIPLITGIEANDISVDELKAFGAAFATASGAPMFHIAGLTPEAKTVEEATGGKIDLEVTKIDSSDLRDIWRELNADDRETIDLVSLGNPHFSLSELVRLNELCRGKVKNDHVSIIVTCSRATLEAAQETGVVSELEKFGVEFITDTCWCMISEPVIPVEAKTLMTNSAKYAHYGPGLTGRKFRFGNLTMCVEAAGRGTLPVQMPEWLTQ
ncbi:MAG: aconitase X, partial [Pseudomonadota bacterium]